MTQDRSFDIVIELLATISSVGKRAVIRWCGWAECPAVAAISNIGEAEFVNRKRSGAAVSTNFRRLIVIDAGAAQDVSNDVIIVREMLQFHRARNTIAEKRVVTR